MWKTYETIYPEDKEQKNQSRCQKFQNYFIDKWKTLTDNEYRFNKLKKENEKTNVYNIL